MWIVSKKTEVNFDHFVYLLQRIFRCNQTIDAQPVDITLVSWILGKLITEFKLVCVLIYQY